jgi:hypothetical protein
MVEIKRVRTASIHCLLLVCATACADTRRNDPSGNQKQGRGSSVSAEGTRQDSMVRAGARTSDDPATSEPATSDNLLTEWVFNTPPKYSVSEYDGKEAVAFQLHHDQGAVILANQTVVVANTDELLYFDPAGRARVKAGRSGAGPGEFRSIRSVFQVDGGVGVFDGRLRRLSLYSQDGLHIDDIRIALPGLYVAGWLSNIGPVAVAPGLPAGSPRRYFVLNANGDSIRALNGPLEPSPAFVRWVRSDGVGMSRSFSCMARVLDMVIGSSIYVVDPDAGQVIALSVDGGRRVVYQSRSRPLVTEAVLAKLRSVYSDAPADTLTALLRRFGKVGDPLPSPWDRVMADAEGRIWLRNINCESGRERSLWEVIDTVGTLLAVARPLSNYALRAARGNLVAAVTFDSMDQPYMNLFRLLPTKIRRGTLKMVGGGL